MSKKQPVVVTPVKVTKEMKEAKMNENLELLSKDGVLNKAPESELAFTLRLRLLAPQEEKEYLDRLLTAGEEFQNYLIDTINVKIKEMESSEEHQNITNEINEITSKLKDKDKSKTVTPEEKERLKQLKKRLFDMYKEYNFTQWGVFGLVTEEAIGEHKEYLKLSSSCRRYVANKVWAALNSYLYGKGRFIRCRQNSSSTSIGVVSIGARYDYMNEAIVINELGEKHYIKLDIEGNDYAKKCLAQKLTTLEITRKGLAKKKRYFAHIGIKGYVPRKYGENGEMKYTLPHTGNVGVQYDKMGCIAYADGNIYRIDIGDRANDERFIWKEVRLQRELDALRREENPDNYNPNGTIKELEPGEERVWHHSKKYDLLHSRLNRMFEKRCNIRRVAHFDAANQLLEMGDNFITLSTNYHYKLRKNPRQYSLSDKEERRFVRDLAPADAKTKLNWKLQQNGIRPIDVPTSLIFISGYNHETNTFSKDLAKKDFITVGGKTVYHGAYIAFLLSHVDGEYVKEEVAEGKFREKLVASLNTEAVKEDFDRFISNYKASTFWGTVEESNEK